MTREFRKRYGSWLVSAAIATAVALWLLSGQLGSATAPAGALESDGAAATATPAPQVRVRSQEAEPVTRAVVVNGRTAPARVVELAAETTGRVAAIGGERGERIDAGGMIVRLDERDRQARLTEARATVEQRRLDYRARANLKGRDYVSETQLQEAAAQLEAARAELKRAELDLDYINLRAPFDGALHERHVELGDYVREGDTVATFIDDRSLIVTGSVSEREVHLVRRGGAGTARLVTGQTVEGRIRYVAPVADPATRTFTVELELDNAAGDLPAGVTAELRIPGETVYAHKVSPALLTLDDDGVLGLKIVNGAGRVEFHPADIAVSTSDGVWIAGLPASSTIITVGQGFVSDGALVETVAERDIAVAARDGED